VASLSARVFSGKPDELREEKCACSFDACHFNSTTTQQKIVSLNKLIINCALHVQRVFYIFPLSFMLLLKRTTKKHMQSDGENLFVNWKEKLH
jgi:hypothetical protein